MSETDEIEVEIKEEEPTGLRMGEFTPVEIAPVKGRTTVNEQPKKVDFEVAGEEKPAEKVEAKVEEVEEDEDDEKALQIEVVEDTPLADRNRKPSEPPKDVTEDELDNYTKKAAKRIKHFSKGYHDERRAKEAAMRERTELENFTKGIMAENERLKGSVTKSQTTMVEQAKQTVAAELSIAKDKYRVAYESGDPDAVVEAQEALMQAKIRSDKVANIRPPALQEQETSVQKQDTPTVAPADPAYTQWRKDNGWYDAPGNEDLTAFALGYHHKMLKEGIDPLRDSKTYYERLNARMREAFPTEFGETQKTESDEAPAPRKKQSTNVVAPASRSTAPRKVTLSRTQVAIAEKLGVPLELYAAKVAEEERKQR